MAMARTMKNSRGIITLLNFSMPSLMPTTTIRVVTRRNPVCAKSGPHVDDTKSENIVLMALCDALSNAKVTDFRRYSTDHPPMTL